MTITATINSNSNVWSIPTDKLKSRHPGKNKTDTNCVQVSLYYLGIIDKDECIRTSKIINTRSNGLNFKGTTIDDINNIFEYKDANKKNKRIMVNSKKLNIFSGEDIIRKIGKNRSTIALLRSRNRNMLGHSVIFKVNESNELCIYDVNPAESTIALSRRLNKMNTQNNQNNMENESYTNTSNMIIDETGIAPPRPTPRPRPLTFCSDMFTYYIMKYKLTELYLPVIVENENRKMNPAKIRNSIKTYRRRKRGKLTNLNSNTNSNSNSNSNSNRTQRKTKKIKKQY